jgi:hypothetical protein
MTIAAPTPAGWPSWQKFLFRFLFIYWILYIAPWTWFEVIPGISNLMSYYYQALDWTVNILNRYLFHIKEELVPLNGSGDTSFGWAQLCTFLVLAFIGMIIWSVAERKRKEYIKLKYWLCLVVRYNIALVCFSYGFIKMLNLQMPFPSYSQLATPLGDLLPMRLSWMFMGYSHLYQGFSGALEVVAGLLLLYRRTTTLGSLLGAGVFLNVAMLNISYDIPVKLFSIHIFLMCLFLLVIDRRRLLDFFLLNRTAAPSVLYEYTPSKKWMRISKTVMKIGMICLGVGFYLYESISWYNEDSAKKAMPPLQAGLYDVTSFVVNNDTLPPLMSDTIRWNDIAIENEGYGSVNAKDSSFAHRYNRSYFAYSADTAEHMISFKRSQLDTVPLFSARYFLVDSNTIKLWGKRGNDSLHVVLRRSNRHFQLAEKQFHWLSESNR